MIVAVTVPDPNPGALAVIPAEPGPAGWNNVLALPDPPEIVMGEELMPPIDGALVATFTDTERPPMTSWAALKTPPGADPVKTVIVAAPAARGSLNETAPKPPGD